MNLPKYSIPKDLKRAIKDSEFAASSCFIDRENKYFLALNKLKDIKCLDIAESHYLQFLKLGLYLEEYQRKKDMRKYEMYTFVVERVEHCTNNKLKIYIQNFNEYNTVLNTSDSLKIFEQKAPNTVYFLKVINICQDYIVVTASKRFCEVCTTLAKYKIIITFNSYEYQCCHYALSKVNLSVISDCFFPVKKSDCTVKPIYKQYWFNKNVFNNPEQSQAVLNILSKSSFPAPYILYGPPGTGKTLTLVESVCQIWKLFSAYILICAPSNAACDVLTKRILDYIPDDNVYRLYSHTQEYYIIDEDIKNCCNYDEDGTVDDLKKVDFSSKKIIVTTLCTSLRLEKLKLQFSYLFIDEAGQATQAEVLLPFCTIKSSDYCQIVISGDHQQLGPNIRSKFAETILGQSIIEKLVKAEPYKKDAETGYDPVYITKLIRNFRSSNAIIHISNELFYENELIACRNKANWSSFPVAFYAVEAMEQKIINSKSSYNNDEINITLFLVKNFIGKIVSGKVIKEKDIGIITPFTLQASKIRENLSDAGLNEVDVGTVEIYQGQEKEIIFISTVRSKIFAHDRVEHLGFLSNPKRFNVALTRAKSCLIVVGNPTALQVDKCWRQFIRFCQENNACRGDAFELMDENYYSAQELSPVENVKKSTDILAENFTLLKIDDGQQESCEKINNFIRKTYLTRNTSETLNSRYSKEDSSVRRSSNTIENTSVTADIINATVTQINLIEYNEMNITNTLNSPTNSTIYSEDNNITIGTDRLNTKRNNQTQSVDNNCSKCKPDGEVGIKRLLCTLL